MKYIDAEKLKEEIKRQIKAEIEECHKSKHPQFFKFGRVNALENLIPVIDSLLQEQPIKGKQVVIITETNGDANINWDCRSLDDVKALLASAQSFIADKQVEELRGIGSGPDYNITEGRFRNVHKFQQEHPEADLEKELISYYNEHFSPCENGILISEEFGRELDCNDYESIARHFYELGLTARKED